MTGWVIVAEADLDGMSMTRRTRQRSWPPWSGSPRPRAGPAGLGRHPARGVPWELDGPGDLTDDAEVGGEFLLRLDDRYVVYETNGVEWDWSELQAADDATAVETFSDYTGD